jgi:hypothetical protein
MTLEQMLVPEGITEPVAFVRWVSVEKVHANSWNPNKVARREMELLHTSISHNGYTQPVVTRYDPGERHHEIVDGFHRYMVMRTYPDIRERTGGLLPWW